MIYKRFQNESISALAMGNMRLPTLGNDGQIDKETVKEMFAYAIEHGINYFDTAWGYHAGQSEIVVGEALHEYPRDSFYLATKFPGYDLSNMDKVEEIFEKQLKKCQVDFFDFYLFHNVCEMNIDAYLDPSYGIFEYLMRQKQNGRIRHLGFSAHGGLDVMRRFLEAYGAHMEFCQLQINYVDWSFQDAKGKVELLDSYGIPVFVMEPLRGGKLANLPPEQAEMLHALRPRESAAAWAFRFLQSVPQVVTVLSGMSDPTQLRENIQTFETDEPLNDAEKAALHEVVQGIMAKTVPCTACRYCTEYCPQALSIPDLLALYNEFTVTGGGFIAPMRIRTMPAEKRPSACIGCQSCEAVCPQQIHISQVMSEFAQKLDL